MTMMQLVGVQCLDIFEFCKPNSSETTFSTTFETFILNTEISHVTWDYNQRIILHIGHVIRKGDIVTFRKLLNESQHLCFLFCTVCIMRRLSIMLPFLCQNVSLNSYTASNLREQIHVGIFQTWRPKKLNRMNSIVYSKNLAMR